MKILNLKLKENIKIKYDDIVKYRTVRKGKKIKVLNRQYEGIFLNPGKNEIEDSEFEKIKNSSYLDLLVGRKDIIIDGKEVKEKKEETEPNKAKDPVNVEMAKGSKNGKKDKK